MGVSELRHLPGPARAPRGPADPLAQDLVRHGALSRSDAALAQLVGRHCDAPLDRILLTEELAGEDALLAAHARRNGTRRLTAEELAAAPAFDCALDPRYMLKHGFVALRGLDGGARIAAADPGRFRALAPELPGDLAGARVYVAPRQAIQDKVANLNRAVLTEAAQARVAAEESFRSWDVRPGRRVAATLACLVGAAAATFAAPVAVFTVLAVWAGLTLLISAALKTAAFAAGFGADVPDRVAGPAGPLPRISILVPLFRETEIAHALINRLSRLTYPKCLLDVVLVLEEEDELTRQTLAAIDLPPWIRPVVVPDGQPRTKPRAMNYALDFCEGEIVGIFDAEDAPDPDQLTAVARCFQSAPPDLVCLQGVLDYYNPRQNWLARCFTIEYAAWFRLILPGLARLGLAIPLGGTTLFFRRDALERLGGWDAHNVTEDADLGFRLARHGYRTEMIRTVTGEEANCRLWPWIRQRSRWLKGYMTTWLVHMRRPRRLYRQLGARRFWGFQAHFVTVLSQVTLAPLLWSFWLLLLGLPHPLEPVVPGGALVFTGSLFLLIEMVNISIHATAVTGRGHRHLIAWAPTMHLYAPLAAIAAYKALYELVVKPFFWDKTRHGLSLTRNANAGSDGAVDLAGIQLEPGHERL